MAFNAVGQYTPNYKTWDHVGNIIPDVEHSEGERPALEARPAEWLPVQFFDKHYENWNVVMPGKIISCDNNGDLVPSQYEDSAAEIIYTTDDVTAGVIDVTTGSAIDSDSLPSGIIYAVSAVTDLLGVSGVALSVSRPIGVAPYAYLQWAGGDGSDPTQLNQHNYQMQHQVAVLCDYVLNLPLVPGLVSAEALTWSVPNSSISVATASSVPIAKNTLRTTITFTGTDSSLFVNEVATQADVKASGDWHVNLRTGEFSVWKATAGAPTASVAYYSYTQTPAAASAFASVRGNVTCGDFLVRDEDSNWQLATTEDFKDIMGQVLELVTHPRGGLERVRTAWSPAINTGAAGLQPGYTGQADQMSGSATGGVPNAVHYSGAADTMVRINLVSR